MKGAKNVPALGPGLAWGLEPLCTNMRLLISVLHLFELFFFQTLFMEVARS